MTAPPGPPAPSAPLRPYRTSVAKKAVMAVTGLILTAFLVGHMVGNLKAVMGREAFDHYADWLRTVGEPGLPHRTLLTAVEIVLAVSVTLHLWSAVSLARQARRARPMRYVARPTALAHRYAVPTLRYGGAAIALFVVWHLLDMTFGVVNPAGAADPYRKVVADFAPSRWYITIFYVLAVIMVGMHLRHGLWSALQTLGLGRRRHHRGLRLLADGASTLLVIGFAAVPVLVMSGVVG